MGFTVGTTGRGYPPTPRAAAQPYISAGLWKVGTAVTITPPVWTGDGTITPTYAWERDDTGTIAGATAISYTPVAGDATHRVRAKITGTSSLTQWGATVYYTPYSPVIAA